jgi:sporulation protein YlmC with PRC-barrel domain
MAHILTGSSVVLAVALIGTGVFAQTPQPPKAVPEAPALGGEPQTKSGHQVISLRANEVALSRLAKTSLMHNTTKQLSDLSPNLYGNQGNTKAQVPEKIGTLTTAWLDPGRKEIVAVSADANGKTVEIPWSKVEPIHQPNDQFQTAMTAQDLASMSQKPDGKAIDVQNNFIGRAVNDASGKSVGKISDVVAEVKSGKLDYVIVNPSGPQLGTTNGPHAVPWSKLKSVSGDKSQPITLTMNDQQVAALPVLGASKAQETPGTRAAGSNVGAKEP